MRLNYNISKDRSYVSYSIDGLDLAQGHEIFMQIKTMVLVKMGVGFEFYEMISGPSYFKFKHYKEVR